MTPEEQVMADAVIAAQAASDAEAAAEAAAEELLAAEEAGKQTFDLSYVQSLRSEAAKYRREAREAQAKTREFEDQNKSETEKAVERAAAAEKTAAQAVEESARLKVALKKGLSADQAKRLVGATEDELEADADSLIALFNDKDDGLDLSGGTPRERLKPGAVPDAEKDETDPAKLAEKVPRPYQ